MGRGVTHQNLDGGAGFAGGPAWQIIICNKEHVNALEGFFSVPLQNRKWKTPQGGGSVIHRSLDGGAGFAGGPVWQFITCNKEQVSALEGGFSAPFGTSSRRCPKVRVLVSHRSLDGGAGFAGGCCAAGHYMERWEVSGVGIEDAPSSYC